VRAAYEAAARDARGRLALVAAVERAALAAVRRHYESRRMLEVSVPVIVGITGACENVSTLFGLANNRRAHLTQTGQLALEHALLDPGVCCVTRSFRTDRVDSRHLHEFTLIEEEFACTHPDTGMSPERYDEVRMFEALLAAMEATMRRIVSAAVDDVPEEAMALGADLERLRGALDRPFGRISYDEAVRLLQEDGGAGDVAWGDDLRAVHEARLLELVAGQRNLPAPSPTFVTRFPEAIKFFNMRASRLTPGLVLSADLLLPGVGEAMGGAVREHEPDALRERLLRSTMLRHLREQGLGEVADFDPYLAVVAEGRTPPHAGYGLGLERALQYVLLEPDIRRVSVPYLLSEAMGFHRTLAATQPGAASPGF